MLLANAGCAQALTKRPIPTQSTARRDTIVRPPFCFLRLTCTVQTVLASSAGAGAGGVNSHYPKLHQRCEFGHPGGGSKKSTGPACISAAPLLGADEAAALMPER